jgi:hypothetical protein
MHYNRIELALARTTMHGTNLLPDLAATAADAGNSKWGGMFAV